MSQDGLDSSFNPRLVQSMRIMPDVQITDDVEERLFYQMDGGPPLHMESHIIPNVERVSIEDWIGLQQKLKEEYFQINQEEQVKRQLLEELNKESKLYYQTYIEVLEENSQTNGERRLQENISKLFGNAATYTTMFFEVLCNKPEIITEILRHHKNKVVMANIESLINAIFHNFYDNIACGSMWRQPILRLVSDMIALEIDCAETPDIKWDKEDTLVLFALAEFSRRPENVKYTKVIYKNALMQITKVDKYLELDKLSIHNKLREIKSIAAKGKPVNRSQPPNINRTASIAQVNLKQPIPILNTVKAQIELPQNNMAVYYSNLIRQYDQQSKVVAGKNSRRNPNQLAETSLKMLQFNQESRPAKFVSLERRSLNYPNEMVSPVRRLSEVYSHQQNSELHQQNEVNRVLKVCVDKLRDLTNQVMASIFKNIYLMPPGLRIICKMMQIHLKRKFKDISEQKVQDNIFSYLFKVWLIPQFQFPKHYKSFKFIKEEHEQTVKLIRLIMMHIVQRQIYNDDPSYETLNKFIIELQHSMKEYLNEILNLCQDSVEEIISHRYQSDGPESQCVCISMADFKTLCTLLKDMGDYKNEKAEDLQKQITGLASNAQKILNINEHEKIFAPKIEANQIQLSPSQQYALILKFSLPENLELNYLEEIKPLQKLKIKDPIQLRKIKICNALRKILLEVQDLSVSPACSQDDASIRRALQYFEEKYTIMGEKTIMAHLKYIKEQFAQLPADAMASNLKEYYQHILEQYQERVSKMQYFVTETKYQLLKAKFNIKKNYEQMKEAKEALSSERRSKQLYEIIEGKGLPINFCITSPKTREGYSVKALKMRNNQTMDESKIWVEDQKECIHNAINLEFIMQFVGGASPNDQKKTSEFSNSHCQDIGKFIEIFASLPEVKESVITGEDKAGVKQAYFDFLKALTDYLNQKNVVQLDQDQLMDNLEKYVSKRIYEKVYPKERTYKDAGLYFRIKTLDWIDYDHLEISRENRVDDMWMLAVDALLQMDNAKTAVGKLDAMIHCQKIMTDILKLTSLKDEAASADTTLPITIYLLLKAAPQRLYSNLNFVELFLEDNKSVGQQGYCLTQIKLAIRWLEDISAKDLRLDQLKFQELIAKNEILYGIHYLKKRPRSERTTKKLEDIHRVIQ